MWVPLALRLIENKAESLGIALRDLRLPVDVSELHGNSERPCYYMGWLAILDTTVPIKGVAYRRSSTQEEMQNQVVNCFSSSMLWKLQGLPLDSIPAAISEQNFLVPGTKSYLVSCDARRNLTDSQETSQWLAGKDVFTKFIQAAVGSHS